MKHLIKAKVDRLLLKGVTLEQQEKALYNEIEMLMDNDRIVQAIDARKELTYVNQLLNEEQIKYK